MTVISGILDFCYLRSGTSWGVTVNSPIPEKYMTVDLQDRDILIIYTKIGKIFWQGQISRACYSEFVKKLSTDNHTQWLNMNWYQADFHPIEWWMLCSSFAFARLDTQRTLEEIERNYNAEGS